MSINGDFYVIREYDKKKRTWDYVKGGFRNPQRAKAYLEFQAEVQETEFDIIGG